MKKLCFLLVLTCCAALPMGYAQFTPLVSNLLNPDGVEVDEAGNVWLTENGDGANNARVSVVKPNGEKIPVIINLPSILDTASGEMRGPWRTIQLENNRLAVIMGEGPVGAFGRILIFNMAGFQLGMSQAKTIRDSVNSIEISRFSLAQTGVTNSNPYRAVLDKDGSWYVADAGANMIVKVTSTGQRSVFARFPRIANPTPIGPPVMDAVPTGIVARPEGGFFVATLTGFPFLDGKATIYAVDKEGVVTPHVTGMTLLTELALDSKTGDLYANQLGRFDITSPTGFLFGSGKVWRIPHGSTRAEAVEGGYGPGPGMAFDKRGNLFVTSLFTSQLLKKANATRCYNLDINLAAENSNPPLHTSNKYTLTVTNRDVVAATNVRVYWMPPYKRFEGDNKPFARQESYASTGRYNYWSGYWTIARIEPGESVKAYSHLFVVNTQLDRTQLHQIADCNETQSNFQFVVPNTEGGQIAAFDAQKSSDVFTTSPNPATDKISIVPALNIQEDWQVSLFNSTGQVVSRHKSHGQTALNINTGTLINGIYWVQFKSPTTQLSKKITVQH